MGIWSSFGQGRCATAESDVVLLPTGYQLDGSLPGIVYCHVAGGNGLAASDPWIRSGQWQLARGIAERYPVVVADLGGPHTYGNDLAVTRIEEARRYLQTRWGARPGPIGLVGVSMGHTGALQYAAGHRDVVDAVVGVIPVCDLDDLYARNASGLSAHIAAAWGAVVGQPLPTRANPLNHVLELLLLPVQEWFASDDPIVPPSTVQALLGLLGLTGTGHDLGPLGHTEKAVMNVPVAEVVAFLADHLGPA